MSRRRRNNSPIYKNITIFMFLLSPGSNRAFQFHHQISSCPSLPSTSTSSIPPILTYYCNSSRSSNNHSLEQSNNCFHRRKRRIRSSSMSSVGSVSSKLYALFSDEATTSTATTATTSNHINNKKGNVVTTTRPHHAQSTRMSSSRNSSRSSSALYATSSEDLKSQSNDKRKRKKKKSIASTTTTTKISDSNSNNRSSTSSSSSSISSSTSSSSSSSNTKIKTRKTKKRNTIIKSSKHKQGKEETTITTATTTDDANAEHDVAEPSFRGIDRLSRAVAKVSADREAVKKFDEYQNFGQSNSSNNNNSNNSNNSSNDAKEKVSSLTQLTEVIDSQLYANRPGGSIRSEFPPLNGVIQNARDSMISLLGFNQVKGDWKEHSSKSTYNVAIVFGKDLVRDQITVEYASRIRALARLFKEDPEFRPSLVCFCGGIADGNHVSSADAGYLFFRHMCEAQGIELDGVGIFIDNASRDDEDTVYCVTEKVKNEYVPLWLESSPAMNSLNQKVVNVHFTMVSTEYHLCNINDVHHRSPQQSLLNAMEVLGESFRGGTNLRQNNVMSRTMKRENSFDLDEDSSTFNDDFLSDEYRTFGIGQSSMKRPRGVVNTSWSFQYATYPYIYSKDETTVFLGKCYLLGEELMPLLVNMIGVVEQREFFQRDNYMMLTSIRRSLVDYIEDLHSPSKENAGYQDKNIIGILESASLSLGRCVDLVKPAGLHIGSVTKDEFKRALGALEHSMSEIRDLDPDYPLRPSEWGKLIENDSIQI